MKRIVTLSSALLILTACGADGGGPAGPSDAGTSRDAAAPPGDSGIPCAVEAVLVDSCQGCHAATPRFGAPMPLMTWDDIQAPSVTDPSRTVAELMTMRVSAGEMPPVGELSSDHETALLDWLAAGTPERSASDSCGGADAGPPPPDAGPPPVPDCDGTLHEFVATADGAGADPYHVPSDESNRYQCFVFPSSFLAGELATSFNVVVGDERVIHHLILYSTPTRPDADSFECISMPGETTFVTGWAPGGGAIEFPAGVGAEVPAPDDWLILQAHYWNATALTDAFDGSGLTACTTTDPMESTAAIIKLGTSGFRIPARTNDYPVVSDCDVPTGIDDITVVGAAPHMHQIGQRIDTTIFRGGAMDRPDDLITVDPWDFNTQGFLSFDEPVVIRGGDLLRTTCVYDNPSDSEVRSGERTEDEMCFNFLYAYPAPPAGMRGCGG